MKQPMFLFNNIGNTYLIIRFMVANFLVRLARGIVKTN